MIIFKLASNLKLRYDIEMRIAMKKWNKVLVDPKITSNLQKKTGLCSVVCDILASRGFTNEAQVQQFLSTEQCFHDPFLMKDMKKAVDRIHKAIEQEEKIVVYGDYDCDGITSTIVLYTYLETIGADVTFYIPERQGEGYGLNKQAIKWLHENDTNLIITVDNGIGAIQEVDFANELGVDVIITDHHRQRDTLPSAYAILNPHQKECAYPFKQLSGVGVAFKLICALEDDDGVGIMELYGDIICIGTIADVVDLQGENRMIAKYGIESLKNTQNVGLSALLDVAGIARETITAQSVAFGIAPRINATGRMDQTKKAVQLFTTEDEELCLLLAQEIDLLNGQRKEIEGAISKEIAKKIKENPLVLNEKIIVISGENWHHGILGIVASRLVNAYGKPVVLLGIDGEETRGSCRSVEGFSMIEAIFGASQNLEKFGGHPQAAGLSLFTKNIEAFKKDILQFANENYQIMPCDSIKIDTELSPKQLTIPMVEELFLLEPFGAGNTLPNFIITNLTIEAIRYIGQNKHTKLTLEKENIRFDALLFGCAKGEFSYEMGDKITVVVNLDINEYKGTKTVSCKILEIAPADFNQDAFLMAHHTYDQIMKGEQVSTISNFVPTREDVAIVYKFIKKNDEFLANPIALYNKLAYQIHFAKLKLVIQVLLEASLIEVVKKEGISYYKTVENPTKVELENTKILQTIKMNYGLS